MKKSIPTNQHNGNKSLQQMKMNAINYEQDVIELERRYRKRKREFNIVRASSFYHLMQPKKWKSGVRTAASYLLGRRNIKRLYSYTYKNKQASNDLKPIVASLYEAGFEEKALEELKTIYWQNPNPYLKRAAAWELLFWYANKQTKVGAKQALLYFFDALYGEKDAKVFTQKAIVAAECLQAIRLPDLGEKLLSLVPNEKDSNVLLAKANLHENINDRLSIINRVYKQFQLEEITLLQDYEQPYQNLYVEIKEKINGPLVTIIMPAFNAADYIETAIQSILLQTWENIEIIVVDDCSTDNTYSIVQQLAEKHKQIKVLQTPQNSGAYVARNIGLANATGEYVTVNDSDDWSHPRKIEMQMKHLLANPNIVANTSQLCRVTEHLFIYRRGTRGNFLFSNMSSLLFKKDLVIETIGYWDEVRFAGDGEYKRRLIRAFGKDSIVDLQTGPLSLPLQSEQSLTASGAFGYHGAFIGARKEYVESFEYYYKNRQQFKHDKQIEQRLYPVPYPMKKDRIKGKRYIDIVFIDDFYQLTEENVQQLLQEIKWIKNFGWKIGFVQMYANYPIKKKQMHEKIRQVIDGEQVQMLVYGEEITCRVQIVRNMFSLQLYQKYIPRLQSIGNVVLIDSKLQKAYNLRSSTFRQLRNNHMKYFDEIGEWYMKDAEDAQYYKDASFTYLPIREAYWQVTDEQAYHKRLEQWNVLGGDEIEL